MHHGSSLRLIDHALRLLLYHRRHANLYDNGCRAQHPDGRSEEKEAALLLYPSAEIYS